MRRHVATRSRGAVRTLGRLSHFPILPLCVQRPCTGTHNAGLPNGAWQYPTFCAPRVIHSHIWYSVWAKAANPDSLGQNHARIKGRRVPQTFTRSDVARVMPALAGPEDAKQPLPKATYKLATTALGCGSGGPARELNNGSPTRHAQSCFGSAICLGAHTACPIRHHIQP